MKKTIALSLVLTAALGLAACGGTPAANVVDANAVTNIADNAAGAMGNAVDNAAGAMTNAVDNAAGAMGNVVANAADAAGNVAK